MKKLVSDARNNSADIATTISSSYDKADEIRFRCQTMTSIFGMETIYKDINQNELTVHYFEPENY